MFRELPLTDETVLLFLCHYNDQDKPRQSYMYLITGYIIMSCRIFLSHFLAIDFSLIDSIISKISQRKDSVKILDIRNGGMLFKMPFEYIELNMQM